MDSIVSSRVHFRCQDLSTGQPTSLPTVLRISLNPGSHVSQTFFINWNKGLILFTGFWEFFHTRTTLELDFYVKGWPSDTHWMFSQYIHVWMLCLVRYKHLTLNIFYCLFFILLVHRVSAKSSKSVSSFSVVSLTSFLSFIMFAWYSMTKTTPDLWQKI